MSVDERNELFVNGLGKLASSNEAIEKQNKTGFSTLFYTPK